MAKFTLDAFKNYILEQRKNDDVVDIRNGRMQIHKSNINKYLEEYMCKNEDDLSDTLYYRLGVWLKIID